MNSRGPRVYESTYDAGREQPDRDFPHYAPAYQFGNWLASQTEYQNRPWEEIEDDVRREWESTHARPWGEYAAVVRHSWNATRNELATALREVTPEGYPRGSIEDRFHQHFAEHYEGRGHTYRDVAPTYHFGYDLAVDSRYQGREWEEIRTEAERRWNKYGVNFFWDAAEPAIAYAWRTTRDEPLGRHLHVSEFEGFGAEFYEHFRNAHAGAGAAYEAYAPAYYLGYDLAVSQEFANASWEEIRSMAEERWAQYHHTYHYIYQHPSQSAAQESPQINPAWEDVEDAVRFAWETMRAKLRARDPNIQNRAAGAPDPLDRSAETRGQI